MESKPQTASGYNKAQVGHVIATCLYVATKLGDLSDEIVIVGGLVPSLLIDQSSVKEQHAGTKDLDLALALGIFAGKRYQGLTERLRSAGFRPDTNQNGNMTRQRWRIDGPHPITVDFLIAPTRAGENRGTQIKNIEKDFAATIAPGLRLAFRDRVRVTLSGKTIRGEQATREIWVCGPAAFVALKALAFRNRGENKDAYDLTYLLRNHPLGVSAISAQLTSLLSELEAVEAVAYLKKDFASSDEVGPQRAAAFLYDARDEDAELDAWHPVRDLIDLLPAQPMTTASRDASQSVARRQRRDLRDGGDR